MSRSFDRYLEQTSKSISSDKVTQEVVVIVADEVAAWARAGAYLEKPVEELPCLAPKWPLTWIEYPSTSGKERRGILIHGEDSKALSGPGAKLRDAAEVDARSNGYEGEIRWAIEVIIFADDGREMHGPFGMVVFVLDPGGRIQGNRWEWWLSRRIGDEEPDHWMLAASMPALFTLSLLHCKNMTTEEVRPNPKLSKKWQRRHGRPLSRYQVLKLELPTTSRSSATSRQGLGGSTAVHMVGGHFAHYGDCCPGVHEAHGRLFGRLEGIYWLPLHLRGNPTQGSVRTDYVVTVNDEAARRSLT